MLNRTLCAALLLLTCCKTTESAQTSGTQTRAEPGLISDSSRDAGAADAGAPAKEREVIVAIDPSIEKMKGVRAAAVEAIQKLPACRSVMQGYRFGKLSLKTTMCTKKFCKAQCCNGCGWEGEFTATAKEQELPRNVSSESILKHLLQGVEAPHLECEINSWTDALADYEFGVAMMPDGNVRDAQAGAKGICLKGAVR